MKLQEKTYQVKREGKVYTARAERGDDGYTYFVDVETGEDIYSMPTRDWRG